MSSDASCSYNTRCVHVQTYVPSHPYHSQYVSRVQISSANIFARKKRMCTCLCTVHEMLSVTCTDMSHEQSYVQCHMYEHVTCLATHVQTRYMFTATCTDMLLDQSHMYVHTCHILSITSTYTLYTQGCLHMLGPYHRPTQQTHTLFCHVRYLRLQCQPYVGKPVFTMFSMIKGCGWPLKKGVCVLVQLHITQVDIMPRRVADA